MAKNRYQSTDYRAFPEICNSDDLTSTELNKGVYILRGTNEEVAAAVVDLVRDRCGS